MTRDRGQPVELKNLDRYLKASFSSPGPTYPAPAGRSIHGAVYWLQLARDAPQEMRIVNLWTALEVLTGSDQTKAIDAVTGAVRPFAVMYYVPLLIESLMSEFQRMMRKEEVPEVAAAAALGKTGRPDPSSFVRFLLCEDLDTSLQRQDILLRKVRNLRSLFSQEQAAEAAGLRVLDMVNPAVHEYGDPFGQLLYIDMEDQKVKILTVHQAKRLEFDTVFVAGLLENEFPNYSALLSGREDEEVRIFYVAVTRARRRLFLTGHALHQGAREFRGKVAG